MAKPYPSTTISFIDQSKLNVSEDVSINNSSYLDFEDTYSLTEFLQINLFEGSPEATMTITQQSVSITVKRKNIVKIFSAE